MDNSRLTINEVYASALAEHPDMLQKADEVTLKQIIGSVLERIAGFETEARQPLHLSRAVADSIGTIWILSGTGSYGHDFKPEDNPRLQTKPWLGGMDRARIQRGILLAKTIAELRSGGYAKASANPLETAAATRKLIEEYGPAITYNGYPVESKNFEALFERPEFPLPSTKAHIIHKPLKTTPDQLKTFAYHPGDKDAKSKKVVIVSSAPHLAARVLHMAQHYKPFAPASVPYVSPVPTPTGGQDEFALMEARGLLYYIFIKGQAATESHDFQFLCSCKRGQNKKAQID